MLKVTHQQAAVAQHVIHELKRERYELNGSQHIGDLDTNALERVVQLLAYRFGELPELPLDPEPKEVYLTPNFQPMGWKEIA